MKRKSLYLLFAVAVSSSLMFSPITANATEDGVAIESQVKGDWQTLNLESYPTPPTGTQLIYSDSFNLEGRTPEDNLLSFVLSSGKYKVLSYDPANGIVYGTTEVTGSVPADEEFGIPAHEYTYETLVPYLNSADLSAILANEPVRVDNTAFKTCTNPEGYLLFFKDNAKSLDDLKFVCKIADLGNYLSQRGSSGSTSTASTNASSSVTLVNQIFEDDTDYCISGNFKVDFNLGKCSINGVAIEEQANCIVIDNEYNFSLNNVNNGSVEFKLTNLENKTYDYYILALSGNKYYGSFTVDFVKMSERIIPEISDAIPVVTFNGYPSEKVKAGTPITMTMNTDNVSSIMSFDGVVLGSANYGKSFEFTVNQNGSYFYSATTAGGKLTEGKLEIDFFEGTFVGDAQDPINKDLVDMTNEDVSTSEKLAITGLDFNSVLGIVGGFLIAAGVVLLLFKRFIGGVDDASKKQ